MTLRTTTLAGSDPVLLSWRLDDLLSSMTDVTIERIDLDTDPLSRLSDLLGAPSLFGGVRTAVVNHVTATNGVLELLERYADSSAATVIVLFTGTLSAKAQGRLEAIGSFEKIVAPTKTPEVVALLTQMARSLNVTLTASQVNDLAQRLDGDFARAHSIFTQLALAGTTTPEHFEALLGSLTTPVAPWDVTDAAANRDIPAALAAATQIDAVPMAVWVGAESLRLARIKEGNLDAASAAKVLKIQPFRAQKLVRWANRHSAHSVRALIDAAANLDVVAKTGTEAEVLSALAAWLKVA